MTAPAPALYRVKDVARILSVSEFEVRRLVETGELHRRYIGAGSYEGRRRFYRITASSVEAYLNSLSEEKA